MGSSDGRLRWLASGGVLNLGEFVAQQRTGSMTCRRAEEDTTPTPIPGAACNHVPAIGRPRPAQGNGQLEFGKRARPHAAAAVFTATVVAAGRAAWRGRNARRSRRLSRRKRGRLATSSPLSLASCSLRTGGAFAGPTIGLAVAKITGPRLPAQDYRPKNTDPRIPAQEYRPVNGCRRSLGSQSHRHRCLKLLC